MIVKHLLAFTLFLTLIVGSTSAQSILQRCPIQGLSVGERYNGVADFVILVPGAGARGPDLYIGGIKWGRYFENVENILEEMNIPYYTVVGDMKENEGIVERIEKVKEAVKYFSGNGKKILIVAHSFGALAARIALRDDYTRKHVSGVVSLTGSHRGSELLDWADEAIQSRLMYPIKKIVEIFGYDVTKKRYIKELTTGYANMWNRSIDHIADAPPVFSVVGWQNKAEMAKSIPALVISDSIMAGRMTPDIGGIWKKLTDGLIPAYSQVWGECLGQVNYNHGSILGWSLTGFSKPELKRFYTEVFDEMVKRELFKY